MFSVFFPTCFYGILYNILWLDICDVISTYLIDLPNYTLQEIVEVPLDHIVAIVEITTVHTQKRDWLDLDRTKIIDVENKYLILSSIYIYILKTNKFI